MLTPRQRVLILDYLGYTSKHWVGHPNYPDGIMEWRHPDPRPTDATMAPHLHAAMQAEAKRAVKAKRDAVLAEGVVANGIVIDVTDAAMIRLQGALMKQGKVGNTSQKWRAKDNSWVTWTIPALEAAFLAVASRFMDVYDRQEILDGQIDGAANQAALDAVLATINDGWE